MKSAKSLPAVKESSAPCTSTTRTSSFWSARSSSSARAAYIAAVIAFFLAKNVAGKFGDDILHDRYPRISAYAMPLKFPFAIMGASSLALGRGGNCATGFAMGFDICFFLNLFARDSHNLGALGSVFCWVASVMV